MTTIHPPNLLGAALELVLSARRRQVAPSTEARAQHLGELEGKAAVLYALDLTGGLAASDVVHLVMLSLPIGTIPEAGAEGLTAYLNEWASTVAWLMKWTDNHDHQLMAISPDRSIQ
jgi:hypothetical protein